MKGTAILETALFLPVILILLLGMGTIFSHMHEDLTLRSLVANTIHGLKTSPYGLTIDHRGNAQKVVARAELRRSLEQRLRSLSDHLNESGLPEGAFRIEGGYVELRIHPMTGEVVGLPAKINDHLVYGGASSATPFLEEVRIFLQDPANHSLLSVPLPFTGYSSLPRFEEESVLFAVRATCDLTSREYGPLLKMFGIDPVLEETRVFPPRGEGL
jgi:hypothetical protein